MAFRLAGAVAPLLLVALAAVARAEQSRAVAIVQSSEAAPFAVAAGAAVETLRAADASLRIESFTFTREESQAGRLPDRVKAFAADALVTLGSSATAAALDSVVPVPHIFAMVLYPQASGLLRAERPQSRGIALDIPLERHFDLLRRIKPDSRRVGVLYHPAETGAVIAAARPVAEAAGLELVAIEVDDPAAALRALEAAAGSIDVLWSVADSHVFSPQSTEPLILAALRLRLPLIGISAAQVRAGAVAALYCDYQDIGRQAGEAALAALAGHPPSERLIPPRTVWLALNLRSANRCGVEVPAELSDHAEMVFR